MSDPGLTAKGRARRAEIIRTALGLLAERGYRDTSLRAIGRELGVQPAQILHYFANREALLEEVITAWDEPQPGELESEYWFLDRWLAGVRRNMTIPGLVHLYTAFAAEAAAAGHPSRAYFQGRSRRVRDLIEADLTRGSDVGRYRLTFSAEKTAEMLASLSDGLQLQWLIDPHLDMVEELRTAMELLTGHRPSIAEYVAQDDPPEQL